MFDELEHLRADLHLFQLLQHYALLGAADAALWQDRLMQMDGINSRDLQRLHGELIAFGWLEQNTGVVSVLQAGAVCGCYRTTTAGMRALKAAQSEPRAA